jgi:predicted lipoprotein with Yx(FWY)xxD motif
LNICPPACPEPKGRACCLARDFSVPEGNKHGEPVLTDVRPDFLGRLCQENWRLVVMKLFSMIASTGAIVALSAGVAIVAMSAGIALGADYLGGAVKSMDIGGKMVLTDANGMTLYTWDKDKAADGTLSSTCYDKCAENWPPLIVDASTAVEGEFTLVDRTDGTKIVAYKGWPLYLWVKDQKPGDTTGDGVGGTWHTAVE